MTEILNCDLHRRILRPAIVLFDRYNSSVLRLIYLLCGIDRALEGHACATIPRTWYSRGARPGVSRDIVFLRAALLLVISVVATTPLALASIHAGDELNVYVYNHPEISTHVSS